MKKHLMLICIVGLSVLVLLSACGRTDFPTGTYATSLGLNELEFSEDGSFVLRDSALGEFGVKESCTYSVQDGELTFENSEYCDARDAGIATYTWTLESDTLTFTPVGEDECTDRAKMLALEWHRKP